MHSFRPSRGRILFEVLCALGMAASFVGGWMQTGATAMLGAAAVATLYGVVHLLDLRQPKSAKAAEPQRIDFATDQQGDLLANLEADAPPTEAKHRLFAENAVEEAEE